MNPHSAYRPDVDGLRAVALRYLSASLVSGDPIGADVFFVISDYR